MKHIDYALVAKAHPPEYLMHKYWARKPHNVVAEYIKRYSRPDEIVMDPFVGSGVTTVEALRLGRRAVAIDLDPFAIFVTRNSAKPVVSMDFERAFVEVEAEVKDKILRLYKHQCRRCSEEVFVFQTVWERNGEDHVPTMMRYRCERCSPDEYILEKISPSNGRRLSSKEYKIHSWYPTARLITNSRINISEGMTLADLFTRRNLQALSELFKSIGEIDDADLQDLLKFVFTSTLPQASKIHSIDQREGKEWGSRGWTVRGYWIPVGFLEENVWFAFESRFRKVQKGKEELGDLNFREATKFSDLRNSANVLLLNQSATDLRNIPDNSVDFVFTDPPYGDNIPYLELHQIWWNWLGYTPDFDSEIVISDSPERNKDFADYERLINVAFAEIYKKLKAERYMIVTFNNTRIDVWNAIIRAATYSGFGLEKILYQPPAVKPSKASLHPYGSSFGDYYLRFYKRRGSARISRSSESLTKKYERVVVNTAKQIIANRGEPVVFQHILNGIVPELNKHGVLLYGNGDVKAVMAKHIGREFDLVEARDEKGNTLGKKWWLKYPGSVKIDMVPLNERVEKAVLNLLRRRDRVSFDDVLQEIFINFPNALTPDTYEVKDILEEYAEKKPGGMWQLRPRVRVTEGMHQEMVDLLVKFGDKIGFDVWTPDRTNENRRFVLSDLKLRVSRVALGRIKKIDVLWIDSGKVCHSFDVENTTGISEAIIRASNIPYPCVKYIVVPDERKNFLSRKLREPLLAQRLAQEEWKIIYYSSLERLWRKVERRTDMSLGEFAHVAVEEVSIDRSGQLVLTL